jgi:phosphotriesterase-related protein
MDWIDQDLAKAVMPNWHFNHIPDDVLPALLEQGVTQDQIDEMLVANPKRVFDTTTLGGY